MVYLLVVRACFFAICTAKGLLQLFYCLIDKGWKGKSRMSWQNRSEPRSSSQLQGQKILSEGCVRRIHTHTLYIIPACMDFSRHRYPFVIFIPLFFCLLLSSFGYKPASRRKQRFRPEPLGKPAYEPFRVGIQFYYNFKITYTDIPLELTKDDQVLLLQGFNDVLSSKREDGKRFSSTSENLKNGSPDQKSRCRTCAKTCYSSFNCLCFP